MKKKTTITYSWSEILRLIEKDAGSKLKVEYVDIKKTGDHDRGNYKEEIKEIDFIILNENDSK